MWRVMYRGVAVSHTGKERNVTELYATRSEVAHWLEMYGMSGIEPGETHFRIRRELTKGEKIQY